MIFCNFCSNLFINFMIVIMPAVFVRCRLPVIVTEFTNCMQYIFHRYIKQQLLQQHAISSENEKLRRLRVTLESQESQLKDVQKLREKLEQQRFDLTVWVCV